MPNRAAAKKWSDLCVVSGNRHDPAVSRFPRRRRSSLRTGSLLEAITRVRSPLPLGWCRVACFGKLSRPGDGAGARSCRTRALLDICASARSIHAGRRRLGVDAGALPSDEALAARVKDRIGVSAGIRVVEPGGIERVGKARRIVDQR